MTTKTVSPELIAYEDLVAFSDGTANETARAGLIAKIGQAFGPDGLGLVGVENVPEFAEKRERVLKLSARLPYLEDIQDCELPHAMYSTGWSHGKEKLGDKPDTAKGSFYYNPVTDVPGTPQDRHKYPYSYPSNKWPSAEKLPEFREKAMRMGMLLKQATVELAKHIDALAARKCPDYPNQFLYLKMKDTDKVKARLLYYFPLSTSNETQDGEANNNDNEEEEQDTQTASEDSWIGWHNDSGFLTALGGDMYVNHTTGEAMDCPDPAAGLYVSDRNQQARQILLPADCLAVQIGECTQIVTAGTVRATPHCVRGAVAKDVARISLPCFVDTPPYQPLSLPPNATREQVLASAANSTKVPPLGPRWTGDDMTFGEFLQKTFQLYYDWKPTA
mmetsp:Transcript_3940/g.7580  ORF Transcript_3940/g.7580 Transcript_3940/m.7580 type:complete len:390 (+) Transcript_3940:49-1218(+)